MAKTPYQIQPSHGTRLPGTGVYSQSYVMRLKTVHGQGLDTVVLGTFPGVITPAAPSISYRIEFEAYLRVTTGRKLTNRRFHSSPPNENMSVATPILAIPPVIPTQPFLPEITDMGRIWARRRSEYRRLVGRTISDSPAYYPFIIPATNYQATLCDLLSEIQRHLLETTIDGGVTWSLWTRAQVLNFLNERISRFFLETGALQTSSAISASVGVDTYSFPSDLIDTRRITWQTGTDRSVLTRMDSFAADAGFPGWDTTTGTPFAITERVPDTLEFTLIYKPDVAGTINIYYVPNFTLGTESCTPLPLPSMWVPYIKYGVMADMLSQEGEANEPKRAAYCEARWKEGIEVAKMALGYPPKRRGGNER